MRQSAGYWGSLLFLLFAVIGLNVFASRAAGEAGSLKTESQSAADLVSRDLRAMQLSLEKARSSVLGYLRKAEPSYLGELKDHLTDARKKLTRLKKDASGEVREYASLLETRFQDYESLAWGLTKIKEDQSAGLGSAVQSLSAAAGRGVPEGLVEFQNALLAYVHDPNDATKESLFDRAKDLQELAGPDRGRYDEVLSAIRYYASATRGIDEQSPAFDNLAAGISALLGDHEPFFESKARSGSSKPVEESARNRTLPALGVLVLLAAGMGTAFRAGRKQGVRDKDRTYHELLIDSIHDIVSVVSPDGKIISINPAFTEILGWDRSDWIGRDYSGLIHPDDLSRARGYIEAVLAEKERESFFVCRVKARDGRYRHFETVAKMFLKANKKIGVLSVARDITEKIQSEEVVTEQWQILDSTAEGIFGLDREGLCTFANLSCAKILGYDSPEDFVGQDMHALLHANCRESADHRKEECRIEDAFRTGEETHSDQDSFCRKSGELFPVEFWSHPFKKDGETQGAIVTFVDITKRKRAEEKLLEKTLELVRSRAEKEQLELFAYVASHDLQEPLHKIMGFSDLLKMKAGPQLDEKGRDYVDRIQKATMRMSRLIEDILKFSTMTLKTRTSETVPLGDVIKEVLSDLEMKIRESNARFDIGSLPVVEGDRVQLRQLFQNLIANAIKFRKKNQPAEISIHSFDLPNHYVQIMVEDKGIGFQEEFLQKIFRPFERLHSKQEYEGSGIGLAICQKIVTFHHGTITAKSAPDKGSTFIITLPAGVPGPVETAKKSEA